MSTAPSSASEDRYRWAVARETPTRPATSAAEYCSPGFQGLQHGRLRGGPRLGRRRDVARDERTLGPLHGVLVQRPRLGQDPPVPGIGAQLLGQGLGGERLQQVAQGAAPERRAQRRGVRRRAQDHGVHVQLVQQVQARGVGQVHIQQHQVRPQAVDGLQRQRRRTRRRQGQEPRHRIHIGRVELGDVEIVVHNQHPEILRHHRPILVCSSVIPAPWWCPAAWP